MSRMNEIFVLDASVAAKWYLREEDLAEIAEEYLLRLLRKEVTFHAPNLLLFEVGHLLTKAQRQPGQRIARARSERAYSHFCRLPVQYHRLTTEQLGEALQFANTFHRGFYDSCYLILAQHLRAPWLTSERRFRPIFPVGFPGELVLTLEALAADEETSF